MSRWALAPLLAGALLSGGGWAAPREAPEAEASSTVAAEDFELLAFGQLFFGYAARQAGEGAPGAEALSAFELSRAEAGLGFQHRSRVGVLVNLEAIRSAGPQSLFGIDNDSLVLRAKHAFASARPRTGGLQWILRAGLIQDVWVEAVELRYDLRGVSPILAEDGRFFDTSDLGASVGVDALGGALQARLALTNGEGRNQRELNDGKNLTAVLGVDALALAGIEAASLVLHLGYRDGSTGFTSQADQRLMAALTARWDLLFAGAEYVRASGYGGRGAVEADGFGAWINGAFRPRWLGALAQIHRWQPDRAATGHRQRLLAGLYADLVEDGGRPRSVLGFPRLRLYLTYTRLDGAGDGVAVIGRPEASAEQAVMVTLSARASVAR